MFERLLGEALGRGDARVLARAGLLAESELLCLGRHTVSGLLTTCGQQDRDWSAAYRLFECDRVEISGLFARSRKAVCRLLGADAPLVAMLDDTLMRKRGRKVAGTSWRRDPLGPRFCNNIIWAQRFLQVSAALPEVADGLSRARAVPISFLPAPSPRKPRRAAPDEEWEAYHAELKASALSLRGAEQIAQLRLQLDRDAENARRELVVTVDGGYTNRTVLKGLPDRVTLIGRVRKDAKLFAPPENHPGRGRKRVYGRQLPTPEQLRQDESTPWEKVNAFAAGKIHEFQVKSLAPCRWKAAGGRDVRIIVIRPLAFRPTLKSRVLYRQPGYLICTDPDLPRDKIIQYYVWRWEIELNFREEKTLLGAGEAQVRNPKAAAAAPAFKVAAYSLLLAANALCHGNITPPPRPKWQKQYPTGQRITTQQLIALLRTEIWGRALGANNFEGFVDKHSSKTKPLKISPSPEYAVTYAFR